MGWVRETPTPEGMPKSFLAEGAGTPLASLLLGTPAGRFQRRGEQVLDQLH